MRVESRRTGKIIAAGWVLAALAGSAAAAEKTTVTYENTVKKIVSEKCIACHGVGAPTLQEFEKDKEGWSKKLKGPRMDTYANLVVLVKGTDAGAFMRRLDDGRSTKDGKPGNMYAYLGSADAERAKNLDLLKKWTGNWTLKRRNELNESELQTITAPEK